MASATPATAAAATARTRAGWLPFAEVSLVAVTLATVASMWRLFADGGFFVPLALHAIAAHVLAAGLRRRGVAPGTSALLCLVAALAALTWGHLLASTTYGFPTGTTARAAVDQLDLAWRTFGEVRAPAPVLDGFLLSAGAAIWVGAWLADLAAFRLWTPFEALIPGGTLFVFASLFSADRHRALSAALWLAAAFTFVLLHRSARQQTSPSWLGSDARHGTGALVRAGAGLAAVAVLAGWLVGPRLPGADAAAIVPFAEQDTGGSRTTVSPLVEIQRRLVEQSQTQLFTVDVDVASRAYWRLTALDIFDGEVWSSRGSFGGADGDLEGDGTSSDAVTSTEVNQHFAISGLAAIWLPAAFEASALEVDDTDVRWDDLSSTLIVGRDEQSSDGLVYDVTSQIPTFDPAVLGAATGEIPTEVRERAMALPSDFPASVADEARRVVTDAGASTPYQQALALQDYFRSGAFTYSLDVPPGHSESAIEEFLFTTRTGYCEQFAGTYAAMARAIGLPARVAVGFTPGDPDPAVPNRFIVRGEHAHAWPEVWLSGVGWVAFEPTPGRGAPGAEAYTGVPESQDTAGESTSATTVVPAPDPAVPPAAPTEGTAPGATTTIPGEAPGAESETITEPPREVSALEKAAKVAGLSILLLVTLVLLAGGSVYAARFARRLRRRSQATTWEAKVRVAGVEVAEALVAAGLVRSVWETDLEFGRRVAHALVLPPVARLGQLLTQAEFDPAGVGEPEADDAHAVVGVTIEAVRARVPWWRRALVAMDPRSTRRRADALRRSARPTGPRIQISALAGADRGY